MKSTLGGVVLLTVAACAAGTMEDDAGDELGNDIDPADLDPDELDESADTDPCVGFAGGQLSGDDPLVLINKKPDQLLRSDWAPAALVGVPAARMMPGRTSKLTQVALDAFVEMADAAKAEAQLTLGIRSGYRSFRDQCVTFRAKIAEHGLDHAKKFSAEPGRSQHQLGTTMDISSPRLDWALLQSMGDKSEGKWMEANAHRFGFALSYPRDGEPVTGYGYEPWHFRFIGKAAAAEMKQSGLMLEQYLAMCGAGGPGLTCPRQ